MLKSLKSITLPMERGREEQHEQQPQPYSLASKFSHVQIELSKRVYDAAQDVLWEHEECDISAYRFKIPQPEFTDKPWFVAVVGEMPTAEIGQLIHAFLSRGEMTVLPEAILNELFARRAVQIQIAPWVEGHYGEQGRGIKFSRKPRGKGHRRRRH